VSGFAQVNNSSLDSSFFAGIDTINSETNTNGCHRVKNKVSFPDENMVQYYGNATSKGDDRQICVRNERYGNNVIGAFSNSLDEVSSASVCVAHQQYETPVFS